MTIKTITNKYLTIKKQYDTQLTVLEKSKKRIEKKLYELKYPHWIEFVLTPIAKKVCKLMPDRYFEILGPFGLNNETAIHFYKIGVKEKNKFKKDNCKSLDFRPIGGVLEIVNLNKKLKRYKAGTIGELNGGNFGTIKMPDTIEELIKIMR